MRGVWSIPVSTLLLVNEAHPLAEEPPAEELLPVDSRFPEVKLHVRAKVMLDQMLTAAGGRGAVLPVSGYRPRREQEMIWADALAEHGTAFTQTYVARPGCSEHQTGLAVDLGENVPDVDFLCPSFPETGACGRLRRLAAGYGFVLRYPRGKEKVTGIGYEPWHFRYVGWPHARLMEERGLVLEEYLDWLRSFPEQGPHLNYRAAGRSFEVYHVPAARLEGLEARLPSHIPCQCSQTNGEGVVLTLWRDAG